MKKILSACLATVFALSLSFSPISHAETAAPKEIDSGRNKLIGYMLGKQLPVMHFSDKEMGDDLAFAAFDLYIKQLDFQKRFLLQEDVNSLSVIAPAIDNNLLKGTIVLPDRGYDILSRRIGEVEKMTVELLAAGFEYDRDESYETDPDKLKYAVTLQDLRERWRKILKGQIISRYLDLVEDQKESKEKKNDEALWKEALEKVTKRNQNFFIVCTRKLCRIIMIDILMQLPGPLILIPITCRRPTKKILISICGEALKELEPYFEKRMGI